MNSAVIGITDGFYILFEDIAESMSWLAPHLERARRAIVECWVLYLGLMRLVFTGRLPGEVKSSPARASLPFAGIMASAAKNYIALMRLVFLGCLPDEVLVGGIPASKEGTVKCLDGRYLMRDDCIKLPNGQWVSRYP
ncbi:MAG: hypothetical protein AAF702_44625 [Chloroflexota bacterium]